LARELQTAGYNVVTMPGSGNYALVPDSANEDSPWSDPKVRMAAEYAIDKQAFADGFAFGYAHPITQMYPEGSMAYDPSLPGRNYDMAKAKQLLAEAGYPDGFKSTIISAAMGLSRDMVVAIQASLAEVGIDCNLEFPQSGAYTKLSREGWKNALLFTPLQLWANPNHTFNYFFGMSLTNYHSLKRPDGWGDMLGASLATEKPDPAMAKKLEAALYNDITVIPINDSTYPWIVADNLHDHGIGTESTVAFFDRANAWISKKTK
jgi:peptide/nickel transport system substrate-binding protein